MRVAFLIARRNIAKRKVRTFLSIASIALGVGTIIAVNISTATVLKSFGDMLTEISGNAQAEVKSISPSGFDENNVEKAAKTKGVKVAAPRITAQTLALQSNKRFDLEILGIDPQVDRKIRNYKVASGRFLKKDDRNTILLSVDFSRNHHIRVGKTVRVMSKDGAESLKVVGLVDKAGPAKLMQESFGIMTIQTAQDLLGLGKNIHAIDIAAKRNVSVQRVISKLKDNVDSGLAVNRPQSRGQDVENLLGFVSSALGFFGVVALFVGGFIILSNFLMSVAARMREFGILKATGALPRQIFAFVAIEAVFLGILGSAFGVLYGIGISRGMMEMVADVTKTPLGDQAIDMISIAAVFLAGVIVTIIFAFYPALRAGRVSVKEATAWLVRQEGGSRVERYGWIAGAPVLLVAVAMMFGQAPSTGNLDPARAGAFLFLIGIALISPALIRPLSELIAPVFQVIFRSESILAKRNMSRGKVRTALTAILLVTSIAMVFSIQALSQSYKAAINDWINDTLRPDFYVHAKLPLGYDRGRVVSMGMSTKEKIEKIKGVATVTPLKYMTVEGPKGKEFALTAIEPEGFRKIGWPKMVEGSEQSAVKRMKDGGWVLASTTLSDKYDLKIGRPVKLKTAVGFKKFRVAGIITDFSSPTGKFMTSWADTRKYFKSDQVDSYEVKIEPNAVYARVRNNLEKHFKNTGLKVQSQDDLRREIMDQVDKNFALINGLIFIALIVSSLGVFNTFMSNVFERTREIGVLRAIGSTRWQIRKVLAIEALIIGLMGAIIGLVSGGYLSRVMVKVSAAESGFPLTYIFPQDVVPATVMISLIVSLVAVAYPARRAAQTNVIEALRHE